MVVNHLLPHLFDNKTFLLLLFWMQCNIFPHMMVLYHLLPRVFPNLELKKTYILKIVFFFFFWIISNKFWCNSLFKSIFLSPSLTQSHAGFFTGLYKLFKTIMMRRLVLIPRIKIWLATKISMRCHLFLRLLILANYSFLSRKFKSKSNYLRS